MGAGAKWRRPGRGLSRPLQAPLLRHLRQWLRTHQVEQGAPHSRIVNTTDRELTGPSSIASIPCSAVASNCSESLGASFAALTPSRYEIRHVSSAGT